MDGWMDGWMDGYTRPKRGHYGDIHPDSQETNGPFQCVRRKPTLLVSRPRLMSQSFPTAKDKARASTGTWRGAVLSR